ncbi:MAG: cytochrome c oxidase subunit 3 [Flavipsychrobacter sp.]
MSHAAATTTETKPWGGGRSPFNVSYGKMMMWFFLLSDALTFGAFLISYGTTRFFSAVWPDPNHVFHAFPFMGHTNLPLVFVSLMTFILIASSVTMVMAVHCGHNNDRQGVIKWLIWTIIGGIAFLSCQAWEWTHLNHLGAWWGAFTDADMPITEIHKYFNMESADVVSALPEHGMQATHDFYNYFFTITGFHGAHVTSGVVFLILVLINTVNGTYENRGHYEMVEKIGLYWHFVDLVWVFVFTCFYLL